MKDTDYVLKSKMNDISETRKKNYFCIYLLLCMTGDKALKEYYEYRASENKKIIIHT